MSAAVEAAPDVAAQLAERRQRLQELQEERERVSEALGRHRDELGRAVAAGKAEREQQAIRKTIADLSEQLGGLDAAIPLVSAEIPPLEAKTNALELARLEAEADRLEAEWRRLHLASAEELKRMARKFAAACHAADAAGVAMKAARRAALRAAGADRDVVFYAEQKDRTPPLGDWESERDFGSVAAALLAYSKTSQKP